MLLLDRLKSTFSDYPHNILHFSYDFGDYINHKNLSENILLRKDRISK